MALHPQVQAEIGERASTLLRQAAAMIDEVAKVDRSHGPAAQRWLAEYAELVERTDMTPEEEQLAVASGAIEQD